MKIGVPKEIKNNEYRVGLTPESVSELIKNNHEVFVQKNAGTEIGFSNEQYEKVGATIIETAEELYKNSELIVKVKEPVPEEFGYLNDKTLQQRLVDQQLNSLEKAVAYCHHLLLLFLMLYQ